MPPYLRAIASLVLGGLALTVEAAGPLRFDFIPPDLNQALYAGESTNRLSAAEFRPDGVDEAFAQALIYSGRMRYEEGQEGGAFSMALVDIDEPSTTTQGRVFSLAVTGDFYLSGDYGLVGFLTLPLYWSDIDLLGGDPSQDRATKSLATGLYGGFRWPIPMGSLFSITPFVRYGGQLGLHHTEYSDPGLENASGTFDGSEWLYGLDLVLAKLALSAYVSDNGSERISFLQVGVEF